MLATQRTSRSLEQLIGPSKQVDRETLTAQMQLLDWDLWLHAGMVTEAATHISLALQLPKESREAIIDAAWLHDLGKLTISRTILDKPGKLDETEWIEMQTHAARGADYLRANPRFAPICPLVRHHHERVDGTGYPDRLHGNAIPFGARVICVIDAFDAMTTERPYRAAMPFDAALIEMRRCAGTQFDPAIVDAFVSIAGNFQKGART